MATNEDATRDFRYTITNCPLCQLRYENLLFDYYPMLASQLIQGGTVNVQIPWLSLKHVQSLLK